MEHFRSTVDQPELRRIAHIGTRNRRGRVAERIGAIPHRLVFEPEVLVLHVHVVDAERLAAIVDRAAARTIGVGQADRAAAGSRPSYSRAECFVADFVIHQHEFPEVRTGPVLDDDLPTTRGRGGVAVPERFEVLDPRGSTTKDPKSPITVSSRSLAKVWNCRTPFLGARVDVPFELPALLFCDDGIGIRRGRAAAPVALTTMLDPWMCKLTSRRLPACSELDLDAVTLVGADGKRLNPLRLHPGITAPGSNPSLSRASLFLVSSARTLSISSIQHIHVAGIEIEPLVERDLDVDRGYIVLPSPGPWPDTSRPPVCATGSTPRIGHEEHVLTSCSILVHHGGGVVHPGVDLLHLRILGHMLHDPLMVLFDHRGTLGLAAHRVLDDRLTFELFRPTRQLMGHRNVLLRSTSARPVSGFSADASGDHEQGHQPSAASADVDTVTLVVNTWTGLLG